MWSNSATTPGGLAMGYADADTCAVDIAAAS